MSPVEGFESVSTWRQPAPAPLSPERTALVDRIAHQICELSPRRLRVAVDGRTGAGKTSFGHEVATAVRALGRPTLRASLDDFKKPWADAIEKGYDRTSGEGYYRNAPDFESATRLLLAPAGPDGDGIVALCGHDPLTGIDHRSTLVRAPLDALLIVDSVFAFRPEYDAFWDFRIWLAVSPDESLRRGLARDTGREGVEVARELHEERYRLSEEIYLAEVTPRERADIVVDNTHLADPVVRWRRPSGTRSG